LKGQKREPVVGQHFIANGSGGNRRTDRPLTGNRPRSGPDAQDRKIRQLEQKIEELDQKLKVDEPNKELKDEALVESAKNGATVTADTSGFTIKSNDGNFLLKIGADLQVDNRTFLGQGSGSFVDGGVFDRIYGAGK